MEMVGIIAEYNPFHNGHIYHLEKVKELFPNSQIVLVMSSHFTERGIPNVLDKWRRTSLALQYGVDLVLELPFAFSCQSADIFAQGAIEILKTVGVRYLVFGSEENDVSRLEKLAYIQLKNPQYPLLIQKKLKEGLNYPTALNASLKDICGEEIKEPNDLLGLSYIKEIIRQDAGIKPILIQRTNSYHDLQLTKNIASATSIRKAFLEGQDIQDVVPHEVFLALNEQIVSWEDYFPIFKYKIYTSYDISVFLDVDEGIEHRILSVIDSCSSMQEFIEKVKTKRYTYNRIQRMITHVLCGFTKEERKVFEHVPYLRVLGFSNLGQDVLHQLKKTSTLPIITKFRKDVLGLQLEKRITAVYASVFPEDKKQALIQAEYQNKPIRKGDLHV